MPKLKKITWDIMGDFSNNVHILKRDSNTWENAVDGRWETKNSFTFSSLKWSLFKNCQCLFSSRNSILCSRILYFWIFPVTVCGNSSTNKMYLGTLKCAKDSLQKSLIWPSLKSLEQSECNLIHADNSSPNLGSGTPMLDEDLKDFPHPE